MSFDVCVFYVMIIEQEIYDICEQVYVDKREKFMSKFFNLRLK